MTLGSSSSSPSATVSKKAAALNDTAAINISLGSSSKVNSLQFINAGGNTANVNAGTTNVTVSGNTVTIKAITAIYNGSNWKLEFTDASGGNAVLIPVDIVTKSTNSGTSGSSTTTPTATVTKTAASVSDTAIVTISLGSKAKMNRLQFTNASGVTVNLGAGTTNVQVSGNTVTITATTAIYNGSNWKLEFTDASGGNAVLVPIAIR